MTRIQVMRRLMWIFFLYSTEACLETEFQAHTTLLLSWTNCGGVVKNATLLKMDTLIENRDWFSGSIDVTNEAVVMAAWSGSWGVTNKPIPDFGVVTGPLIRSTAEVLPSHDEYWQIPCSGSGRIVWKDSDIQIKRFNCYPCGNNKITPPDSNTCMCRAGQFPGTDSVCVNCLVDTYKNSPSDATCSPCVDHSTSPAGSTNVSNCLCKAGRTITGAGACVQCQNGTYKEEISNGQCNACPDNSHSSQGSSESTACVCNAGYIGQSGGTCTVCEAGKYKSDSVTCTGCKAGTYSLLAAQSMEASCINCQIGTYNNAQGMTKCIQCEAGKFQDLVGKTQCTLCPVNEASGNGFSSCVLCDRGKYWFTETSVCTACAVPKYKTQLGSAACLSCVGDSVFIVADQVCTQLTANCITGYYYEGLNCVRCPHNHTTPTSPAIYYRDSCVCMAGFQKISNTVCTACPPGFYSPTIKSTCVSSPRGTIVQFPGSTAFQKCPKNWVSQVIGSIACTPCPFDTYSNIENTLCMPGSENKVIPAIQTEYKIRVFCLDPSSRGFRLLELTLVKNSGVSWNVHRQKINEIYPNFVKVEANFTTFTCTTAYLHSTPTTCNFNMFMMRIHSYIWECVSCPVGMYKDTNTLLYSDCKPCSNGFCPELQQPCDATKGIYVFPSNPTYTEHFKYIIHE